MMRSALPVLLLLASISRAEIIDRILVSVGHQIITESELRREVRLTAFLNGAELDFRLDSRHRAMERLIDQKLIRREMELESYPQPDAPEADSLLLQAREQRFPGKEDYPRALRKYGISEADLKTHLLWQAALLRFLEFRFRRPGENGSPEPKIDRQLDEWLRQVRARTRIEYRPESSP